MNWNLNVESEKVYNTLGWMCRMLGYHWVIRETHTINPPVDGWQRNYPVGYDHVECAGSVVPQCRYQQGNGGNSDPYMSIKCNSRSQLGDASNYYLVDKDKQHTQEGHGILMYNGGTVSGNKFDDTAAELVCRIMGYGRFMSWSTGKRYQFQDCLPVTLNDLNCLESEKVFPSCTYGEDTSEETHDNDIWLWCALPEYNFRLVCPPGQFKQVSSNTCVQCRACTYSPDPSESSSCLSCPSNSTSLAGSTFCSCGKDTYMNFAGDQCVQCPGSKTSKEGSTSVADCISNSNGLPRGTIIGLATAGSVISLIIIAAMLRFFYLRWKERR